MRGMSVIHDGMVNADAVAASTVEVMRECFIALPVDLKLKENVDSDAELRYRCLWMGDVEAGWSREGA